ncbi:hypothetical protein [Haloarcula montana]|uniref:hypothetical protein n=1 Tax=Haloarcula montana TaxID=3111776 RepID=UPI002D798403|nr:hypothetical protein [Haloarcula sp. GH36]
MSHHGLPEWISTSRRDVSLAWIVSVLSVLLLGLSLFASQPFLLVIPIAAGVGSGLYLLTQSDRGSDALSWDSQRQDTSTPRLPRAVAGYLPSIVLLGLSGLVLSINQIGTRTAPVYLLTGAIAVGIFAQILFVDDDHLTPGLVLAQLFLAALVIRLSALYATPGFVGVDIWTHATVFVEGIAREGSLAPLAGDKYVMAPLYHVTGAIGALLLGGVRNGIYLTIGVLVPLSALFVYATGRMLLSARWALLAAGFYTFSDQFIRWGLHIIPTSLGLVLFLAALYAVTRVLAADAELWAVGLLLVSSLAIVFTHQVSTVIALVVLGVTTLVSVVMAVIQRDSSTATGLRKAVALSGVFVTVLATTLLSWSMTPFTGGTFLSRELAIIRESITENAGFLNLVSGSDAAANSIGPVDSGGLLAAAIPYVELFGFAVLLLTTVLGGLYMLYRAGPVDLTSTYLLTGGLLFTLTFGLSLFGVRALLPGRWIAFLYVPMALIGAAGLYYVSRSASSRVVIAVFLVVTLGYPTTMVVAEKATLDSPAFDDEYPRFTYTSPEIAAVETISASDPPASEATIATDHPYVSLFRRVGGYGYDASILELGPAGPEDADAVVYRTYQSTNPVTFHRAPTAPGFELGADVEASVCPAGWNSAYTNSQVKHCTPSSLTAEGDR